MPADNNAPNTQHPTSAPGIVTCNPSELPLLKMLKILPLTRLTQLPEGRNTQYPIPKLPIFREPGTWVFAHAGDSTVAKSMRESVGDGGLGAWATGCVSDEQASGAGP